jgi:putative membrane-bound dehydrogenase-like protein
MKIWKWNFWCLCIALAATTGQSASQMLLGAARVDITPDSPIWLSGYGARYSMATNAGQRLWAKALAIGSDADGPALFLTVDNCGVSAEITEALAARIFQKFRIPRDHIVVCSTHTHTAPCLSGVLPNLFSRDFTPSELAGIEMYTKTFLDKLALAAAAALKSRKPGNLSWAQTTAGFAKNRRTANGPVDQALPVLKAEDAQGNLIAVVAAYACHCTTLGSEYNQFHGDWAGEAGAQIEQEHPGAVALISIGCGADANPNPRGKPENARQHGGEVAAAVNKLLGGQFKPLAQVPTGRFKRIELPFSELPTREQWQERAKVSGIVGYHARKNLARLDNGEQLPTKLPYAVQTWVFGEDLAMVFLAGEVVVDYSLRLKRDFDPTKLWVNGYANEVPCYIPSRRILQEGGYEAETSLWYYDRPARLAPATEDLIVRTVHELMPPKFKVDPKTSQFPPPLSPAEALGSLRVTSGYDVELAVSEPLIESPVAIDFGSDGRLWVAEMRDYPSGMDGKGKAGGRIKVLKSSKHDGHYDSAAVFLDDIPFPTGLMAWGKGVLACAAPDILYAEDTDGDGKADSVKKIFTGYATHNFQARVNSLRWGLDGWIYGSSGIFGGKIKSLLTGKEVDLTGRDFRMHPDTGEIESVHGLSQQGRVRDDFGNWFGCDNSTLLWHFPLPDYYLRRNPWVTSPNPRVYHCKDANPNQLFPISRTLERFNNPESANHTTSACGLEIYRGEIFGNELNAFVCEPVHNLVRRMLVAPEGVTFAARRFAGEGNTEFLASADNWFRPVETRTGPDGALWIVDMYRFVIEHPRWISADRLSQLDVRAGEHMGRIYRVVPKGKIAPPMPDLTQLSLTNLIAALESSSGTARDLVHREFVQRKDPAATSLLRKMALQGSRPQAQVQALWILQNLQALDQSLIFTLLKDPNPLIRQQTMQAAEPLLNAHPAIGGQLLKAAGDTDPRVAFQLALSLGEWNSPRIGPVLAELTRKRAEDPWMRAAVLSSATRHYEEVMRAVAALPARNPGRDPMFAQLLSLSVGSGNSRMLESFLAEAGGAKMSLSQVGSLLQALERAGVDWTTWSDSKARYRPMLSQIRSSLTEGRRAARDPKASDLVRKDAIRLLGAEPKKADQDLELLRSFLEPGAATSLQEVALERLRQMRYPQTGAALLSHWSSYSPATRSGLLSLLVSREAWIAGLLDAMEKQTILAREMPLDIRQRLLNASQPSVKARAAALIRQNSSEGRAQVLARYQPAASLSGDPIHGSQLFERTCAVCHALRGRGQAVGPNLAEYQSKKVGDFLLAILDPNAAIEPKYVSYEVEMKDGRSLTGLIRNETASSFQLVQPGGLTETVLRTRVTSVNASKMSLMPEGLEEAMSLQEMADLIAYLRQSIPGPFGGAAPEQAAQAKTDFLSLRPSGCQKLLAAAEQIDYPSWLGKVPLAVCRQTDGKSILRWQTPAIGTSRDGLQKFFLPAAMGFLSDRKGTFHFTFNNRASADLDVTLSDQTWQSQDGKLKLTYTVKEANAEDSNGILLVEASPDLLEAGKPATIEVTGSPANSQRWFGIYLVQ